ncbi:cysteine synthase A [Dongia rigui]|uniref:Cysteine synthase A n=1 Tax=Dongia rigui TaxID=940149 RepID=A0ABU5E1Y6_9PROT|nr:cysteine synthase A [Dongia rigui]MDY0873608.1 cysteine synthase A [Dongia rigui]
MDRKYTDITKTIGRTPVVKLSRLAPAGVDIFAKIEAFNPMGSVKDRFALAAVEDAERRGLLKPGQTVVEATSGNTGISLAMVCAQRGYPFVAVMAENFSIERRKLMRFLGAKVVLTPAAERGSGMLAKAQELAKTHGWFLTRQFDNEANAEMHARTTAQEILADFDGERLDFWITGYGTGGTLKGVARILRQARPETKIVVAEPDNSPLLGSGIRSKRHSDGAEAGAHPAFRPHLMQGWTPDFISRLVEDSVDLGLIDEIVGVAGNDALAAARDLAGKEGILAGITAGATLAAARALAERAPKGSRILCMLPDTGERYLSTPLFADVPVEMTAEELSISRSTPLARFDGTHSSPKVPTASPEVLPVSPEAAAFVAEVTSDPENAVVMFALEWCEFCWSVRKMFAHHQIPFRSVDLDSVAYQKDDWGGKIRVALSATTHQRTIPQIFIAGRHIGGCTDLFDAWKAGTVQRELADAGITCGGDGASDPYSFLPGWLHKRG